MPPVRPTYLSGYKPSLEAISSRFRDRISSTTVNAVKKRIKNYYTSTGVAELASLQKHIKNNSKFYQRVFTSDISKYPMRSLKAMGISDEAIWTSRIAGFMENILPFELDSLGRDIQFNSVARNASKRLSADVAQAEDLAIMEANEARAELLGAKKGGTLNEIANFYAKEAKASALQRQASHIGDLNKQIGDVFEGKTPKSAPIGEIWFNSQQRQFANSELGESIAQSIKTVSENNKQAFKYAKPKRKFSGAGIANAGAGLVALDFAGDKVVSMLPKAAAVYGGVVATSYAVKRIVDGAINRNLAEASHILEDVGLKDQIWSKVESFADSHGGELPSKEQLKKIVHDEIDSYFENEDRTLGQKLQDTVKEVSNTGKKYSNAVASYFNSNQSQN